MLTPQLQPRPFSKQAKRSMSNSTVKESETTKTSFFDLSKSFVIQKRPLTKSVTLENLRLRNSPKDEVLTPDLAVRVIREFIMPLFKLERKQQDAKRRFVSIGLGSPERLTGGIFNEMKLSDTLHLQLQGANEQIDLLNKQLKMLQQHKEQASNDASIMHEQNVRLQAQLGFLRLQYNDLLIENQQVLCSSQGKDEQSEDLKRQVAGFDRKNLELVSEVQELRDKIDIRL